MSGLFAKNEAEDPQKNEKRKILVVGNDLSGLGFSPKELVAVLEKLNKLHREGKVQTVEEARELAPTLDISELKADTREEKPKPPRHTKRKGERY